jgi:hypothetical protein
MLCMYWLGCRLAGPCSFNHSSAIPQISRDIPVANCLADQYKTSPQGCRLHSWFYNRPTALQSCNLLTGGSPLQPYITLDTVFHCICSHQTVLKAWSKQHQRMVV